VIPTQPDGSSRLAELRVVLGDNQKGEFADASHKLLVTPEEAAAILSVGRTTVYELIASGELESVHVKSCRRLPVVALERFVRRLLEGG
jgi:excisionase family DNA binding protein